MASVAGVLEVHSFDAGTGELRRLTDRPEGTSSATIDDAGEFVWWFDDTAGDEYGVWRRQPFGSAPGEGTEDALGLPAAYPAGLAIGRSGTVVVGSQDDEYGTRIDVVTPSGTRRLYEHREDAWAGDLSPDEQWVAIAHSERGDSRHPDLRVLSLADGSTVAELSDGPGKGVSPIGFSPVRGDARLLVEHERAGRPELLVLDLQTGRRCRSRWAFPARSPGRSGRRTRPASSCCSTTRPAPSPTASTSGRGSSRRSAHDGQRRRRDGPPRRRRVAHLVLRGAALDGAPPRRVRPAARPGEPAPPSVEVSDVWVDGPGGRIHALLRRPAGFDGPAADGRRGARRPTAHDADAFRPYCATWVDEGFAVVQVNYRGSTGYGSAWRDALEARVGHVELEDVAAVADHLVATGVADPDRSSSRGRRGAVSSRCSAWGRSRSAGPSGSPGFPSRTTSRRTRTRWRG